jgi:5-dehydro-4-deoxyglucarate dehydratase
MLQGLLFFPVTPFAPDGGIDHDCLSRHVRAGVRAGAGAVFVACGTGEFHALAAQEVAEATATAVAAAGGRVPVYAGTGGPLRAAVQGARAVAAAGGDGLLLLPPYLVQGPPHGLVAYVREVAAATALPVVVYHRAPAVFTPATAAAVAGLPTVAGLKDGVGDTALLAAVVAAVRAAGPRPGFQFFNGMPTAEVSQPGYERLGVRLYSSAVFAFCPEVAGAYHRALRRGDDATVAVLVDRFFRPFAALRDEVPGYAVGLIKAGLRLRGWAVGGVRPPLTDPTPGHERRLAGLLATGLDLAGGLPGVADDAAM